MDADPRRSPSRPLLLAACALLLAPTAPAHPDTPYLSGACQGSPASTACPGLEAALALACPVGDAAFGGNRRFCATPDMLAALAGSTAGQAAGAAHQAAVILLPPELPRPQPGPVPEVASGLQAWLDRSYDGREFSELWALLVGASAPDTFTQVFLTVQRFAGNNAANALTILFREAEPGSQGGTVCIAYTFARAEAGEALQEQWEFLGLGPFPEEALPAPCRSAGGGPPAFDPSLGWLPARVTLAWHPGPYDPATGRCTGPASGTSTLPDPAQAVAVPGEAGGARCVEVRAEAGGLAPSAALGVPARPAPGEVGR